MAILSDAVKLKCHQEIARLANSRRSTLGNIKRQDLRKTIDQIDAFLDASLSTFDAIFPEEAKTALTVREKTEIFIMIAKLRIEEAAK